MVRALSEVDIYISFRVGSRAVFVDCIFINLFSRFILSVHHRDYFTALEGNRGMLYLL